MSDATIVDGAGWRQTTPHGDGARTYRDLLDSCPLHDATDHETPSVTAVLDVAWPKDLTGWHDWLIAKHAEAEWQRLVHMTGREAGVELAQVPTVTLAEASTRGTAVHDVAELEVQGEPADYRAAADRGAGPWLPAVVAAFRALDLQPVHLEAVVFGPNAAGTLDGLGIVGPNSVLVEQHGMTAGELLLWDNKSRTAGGGKLAIRDSEVAQLGGYLEALEDGYAIVGGKRVKVPAPDRLGVLTFAPVTGETISDRHWRFTEVDADVARRAWACAVDMARIVPLCKGTGMLAGDCTPADGDAVDRLRARLLELDVDEQGAVRAAWPGIPSLADPDAVHTVEGLELLDRVIDTATTPADTTGDAVAPVDPAACIAEGAAWLVDRISELAAGGYREQILDAVRAAAVDHELPALKGDPGDLTVDHLEQYRLAVTAVETAAAGDRDYNGTLKVRRQVCGPWAPASSELTDPLRARLEQLPADLAAAVRDDMQAAGIRPTSLPRWLDVPVIEQLVDAAARRLEGRIVELDLHIEAHGEAVVRSALELITGRELEHLAGDQLLDDELEQLAVVVDAVAAGLIRLDDSYQLVPVDGLLNLLLGHDRCTGKRDLLTLGRQIAADRELDTPGSSDDVAVSPWLAAFVWCELEQRPANNHESEAA